jgi:hypothetical protein
METEPTISSNKSLSSRNPIKTPSLDLLYQLMKDNIAAQVLQISSLDTKANSVQVAATALVGVALALQASLIGVTGSTVVNRIAQIIALLILLAVYLPAIIYASKGYRVREFRRTILPKAIFPRIEEIQVPVTHESIEVNKIMEDAYRIPEDQSKMQITSDMVTCYLENHVKIDNKVHYIRVANLWLLVETGVFILVLVLQVLLAFKLF